MSSTILGPTVSTSGAWGRHRTAVGRSWSVSGKAGRLPEDLPLCKLRERDTGRLAQPGVSPQPHKATWVPRLAGEPPGCGAVLLSPHPAHPRLLSLRWSPRAPTAVCLGGAVSSKSPSGWSTDTIPAGLSPPSHRKARRPHSAECHLAWGTVPSSSPGKPRAGASNTENTAPSVLPRGSRATGRGRTPGRGSGRRHPGGAPV